jgi:hypothetical protein
MNVWRRAILMPPFRQLVELSFVLEALVTR